MVQDYRVHRMTSKKHPKTGEPLRPARSTIHHEIVTLRHVLKTAQRYGWLKFLPDLSPPYKASGKISHRAWFSLEEYKRVDALDSSYQGVNYNLGVMQARLKMYDDAIAARLPPS